MSINYRFLSPDDFAALHAALLEAFSDYIVPFQLTETQFKNHIAVNAVEINRSVGAFGADGKMVGFTLNGFDSRSDEATAYDAGTGVIPGFRGMGIAREIFEFMTPVLKQNGVRRILLEVITGNEKAVRLYRRMGFQETRKLLLFEERKRLDDSSKADFVVREITAPQPADWNLLKSFWDGNTSWQNSVEAVERSLSKKIVLGAFSRERCVGYGIVFPESGSVAQLAVDKNHRRKGIGSLILNQMRQAAGKDKPLRAANVDDNLKDAVSFLKNRNFGETLCQFEMIKQL
ncbi:MAG TPA: GNAT family N-acetyltransferase [Pyrinomonadaceae bacterium]|nr:GNAT family N-acetyltransferase [Pyrinomonadaceae bacterium]